VKVQFPPLSLTDYSHAHAIPRCRRTLSKFRLRLRRPMRGARVHWRESAEGHVVTSLLRGFVRLHRNWNRRFPSEFQPSLTPIPVRTPRHSSKSSAGPAPRRRRGRPPRRPPPTRVSAPDPSAPRGLRRRNSRLASASTRRAPLRLSSSRALCLSHLPIA
jgi:hypothetical protein